jgi:hypothetical protein
MIHGIKGFNKDLKCTPSPGVEFQYELGKEYEEPQAIVWRLTGQFNTSRGGKYEPWHQLKIKNRRIQ